MNINLSYSSGCYCLWSGCNVPLLSIIWGRNIIKIIYIVVNWTLKNFDNKTQHNFHTFFMRSTEAPYPDSEKDNFNKFCLEKFNCVGKLRTFTVTYAPYGNLQITQGKGFFLNVLTVGVSISEGSSIDCFNSFLVVFINTEKFLRIETLLCFQLSFKVQRWHHAFFPAFCTWESVKNLKTIVQLLLPWTC